MKKILKELYPYVIIVILVVLFRTFIATPILVKGRSMYDTLSGNEMMILNKLAKIDRYDIVVVDEPEDDYIIKRVIALPGETVYCENNTIYVNNKIIDDKYAYGETYDFEEIKLKDNEYFVMGDNREVSKDSRIIGPVTKKEIKGTTKFVLFPFNKIGFVK
jgi:signal peptidase I